jgi:hypothetical protein
VSKAHVPIRNLGRKPIIFYLFVLGQLGVKGPTRELVVENQNVFFGWAWEPFFWKPKGYVLSTPRASRRSLKDLPKEFLGPMCFFSD